MENTKKGKQTGPATSALDSKSKSQLQLKTMPYKKAGEKYSLNM